jgi:hypothetical protein
MSGKNTAVFGLYPNRSSAENGVDTLKQLGFRNTDISVLFPENVGSKDFGHKKGSKAPEGAATGAGSGAILGGALGWLVGIGALAIPGLGPFVVAGPIMAALAGAGMGGAAGGITGALIGMGIPEYVAKRYEGRVRDGGILLSVHSDNSDWTRRAKEVLERTGAQDISSSAEAGADYAKSDRPVARTASDVEAVQIPREKKAVILDHQTRPSQCPQCGISVHSDAELRDHEKTCISKSERQSGGTEMDSSEVARKSVIAKV